MQKTVKMAQCALSAAMIAVCAWVTVPAAVPFTLQSLGVYLALLLFGGKYGTATVATYLLLGAVGLPVFAGGGGGIGVLCGVTGGYLWGFLLAAVVFWVWHPKSQRGCAAALAVGQMLCYLLGTVWFSLLTGDRFGVALVACVLPFLLPDMFKTALALWLAPRIKKAAKL
ncbi:MAG: biotin transporter BioY [Ruminococcaceae bacterium]|nr:biotin transporter BioY [Oscillospiraceae bacterium]